MSKIQRLTAACLMAAVLSPCAAWATTPTEQLAAFSKEAGTSAQPGRGQQFFTSKHGKDWSCASCHTEMPTVEGKHASTGKVIRPMAPAANADRFTDVAKIEKWFRRNCNDVVGRECSAAEKADVVAWLLTLKL